MSLEEQFGIVVPCVVCNGHISKEYGPRCEACVSFVHLDCWNKTGRCTTPNCANA
ncbi:hypothetical protein M2113_000009 [Aurantimicrobium minutum]|nr:hypothetical protein [Aurantimicrobium minutum]